MHVDVEDKILNDKSSSSFGQRGATLINESGLYATLHKAINLDFSPKIRYNISVSDLCRMGQFRSMKKRDDTQSIILFSLI